MHAIGRLAPFIVLFCVALYLFALTKKFEFPHAPGRLGPDVWPQALLVLLMLTCVVGFLGNLSRRTEAAVHAAEPSMVPGGTADGPEVPSHYGPVAAGVLLFLAYPVALGYVGFLLATFLLMAIFMMIGRWRNPLGVLASSMIGTLALFYVFRGVVYVSLPLGIEPFQSATLWVARVLGMR